MNQDLSHEESFKPPGWKKFRLLVIMLSILPGLLLLVPLYYWLHHRTQIQCNNASNQYENLFGDAASLNIFHLKQQANQLIKNHPNTYYAQLAALQLARQAVFAKHLDEAEYHLTWLVNQSKNSDLQAIACLRLARVLNEKGQSKEALQLLSTRKNQAYEAAINLVRGDILLTLNRKHEALEAYKTAQRILPGIETMDPFLSRKIDDMVEEHA